MSNEAQTLMLGDIDIGSYVRPLQAPLPISVEEENEKESLKKKIAELKRNNSLSFEQFLITDLENELEKLERKSLGCELESKINFAGYPEIDLSFLEKCYDKKIGEIKEFGFLDSKQINLCVKAPAFSVYPFYSKENTFRVSYEMQYLNFRVLDLNVNKIDGWVRINGGINEEISRWIISPLSLVECGEISCSDSKSKPSSLKRLEYKNYSNKWKRFITQEGTGVYPEIYRTLTSTFNGIIPQKTKEKVYNAIDYFEDEVYLVAETKPEEWDITKIKDDPLVIGMKNDKAYLIDHFNTTPLENLVKDIYVGRRN